MWAGFIFAAIDAAPQLLMRLTPPAYAVKESNNGDTLTATFDSMHNLRPARAWTEKRCSPVISTISFGCLLMADLNHL